jgi:hypothetical protein
LLFDLTLQFAVRAAGATCGVDFSQRMLTMRQQIRGHQIFKRAAMFLICLMPLSPLAGQQWALIRQQWAPLFHASAQIVLL